MRTENFARGLVGVSETPTHHTRHQAACVIAYYRPHAVLAVKPFCFIAHVT